MKLVWALHGLKSSGASWRQMLKDSIELKMGFTPSTTDPGMSYRRIRHTKGSAYYELLLVYIDDVLAISHDPKLIMEMIGWWGRSSTIFGVSDYLFLLFLSK